MSVDCGCVECGYFLIVNKKYKLCDYCNYKRLHDGKSQKQVALEKQRNKPRSFSKKKPVKRNPNQESDRNVYNTVWERNTEHKCEECNEYLGEEMKPLYMSHIISKGAKPELRHDPENFNVLCFEHHRMWEDGTEEMRSKMKIFEGNKKYREKVL